MGRSLWWHVIHCCRKKKNSEPTLSQSRKSYLLSGIYQYFYFFIYAETKILKFWGILRKSHHCRYKHLPIRLFHPIEQKQKNNLDRALIYQCHDCTCSVLPLYFLSFKMIYITQRNENISNKSTTSLKKHKKVKKKISCADVLAIKMAFAIHNLWRHILKKL